MTSFCVQFENRLKSHRERIGNWSGIGRGECQNLGEHRVIVDLCNGSNVLFGLHSREIRKTLVQMPLGCCIFRPNFGCAQHPKAG